MAIKLNQIKIIITEQLNCILCYSCGIIFIRSFQFFLFSLLSLLYCCKASSHRGSTISDSRQLSLFLSLKRTDYKLQALHIIAVKLSFLKAVSSQIAGSYLRRIPVVLIAHRRYPRLLVVSKKNNTCYTSNFGLS